MPKEIRKILVKVKKDELSIDKAVREILVCTGGRKSATCKLDRPMDQCSIFHNTKGGCMNCGHFFN